MAPKRDPGLSIMEASLLWDLLMTRYKCIEETQIYENYAHDLDLKQIIKFGLSKILEQQANELEKLLAKNKIPMPSRPPKAFQTIDESIAFSDQFLLRQIFTGCQTQIDYLARICRSIITNDDVRKTIMKFLEDELSLFNQLCKYAKLKGWIEVPPLWEAD